MIIKKYLVFTLIISSFLFGYYNQGLSISESDDVDAIFSYMKNDKTLSGLGKLESKPENAIWGERFFHALDPDGYKLSFATPIGD